MTKSFSQHLLSRGLEAALLPGVGSGASWAPGRGAAAQRGQGALGRDSRPARRAPTPGRGSGRRRRAGVWAPPATPGGSAGPGRAACYLFLLLAEPRHLRGAQRRGGRGRGRGRGVGPGVGRGLHGGGAGTSAGRTSPKQVFMETAWPAAAQRPRARPHALRAPR